jgi:hypothetical protein
MRNYRLAEILFIKGKIIQENIIDSSGAKDFIMQA